MNVVAKNKCSENFEDIMIFSRETKLHLIKANIKIEISSKIAKHNFQHTYMYQMKGYRL